MAWCTPITVQQGLTGRHSWRRVERLQQRSLEKCARLQADIQATKTQKVL